MPDLVSRVAAGGPYTLFSGKARTTSSNRTEVGRWPSATSKARLAGVLMLEADALGLDESSGATVSFRVRATFQRGSSGALERVAYSTEVAPGTSAWNVAIEATGNSVAVALFGGNDPVSWAVSFRALLAKKDT